MTYGVALFEKELSQVRTILAGDTCDQSNFAVGRHDEVIDMFERKSEEFFMIGSKSRGVASKLGRSLPRDL